MKRNPASKKRFKIGEWLGALILLSLLTWFLLWPAFQNVRDSFSAHNWPTATAKITTSKRNQSTNGGGRTSVSYRFRYEYQVNGQAYTGWRYSLSTPGGSQSTGVQLHRRGETVAVHYNPEHPDRSAVDVESSPWWNYVVLGVSLSIGSVVFLASGRRGLSLR